MMKKHFINLVLLLGVINVSTAKPLPGIQDTVKRISDINISSNILTKGLSDIEVFDIYQDTLYLVNKNKLVEIDIKSGSISLNIKVNLFLDNQLKANKYARQIVARKDCYYISFLNELYIVSKEGEASKVYVNYYFINDFEVLNENILIASRDSIKMICKSGRVLASMPFGFTDAGYIKTSQGICYAEVPEDSVYDFKEGKGNVIDIKKFAPLTLTKGVEDPFISYASNDYFIGFSYKKRNAIYVFKKGNEKNEIVKTFILNGLNYTPTLKEMQDEEGNPNFKVGYSNDVFYLVALVRGRLKISSFIL